MSNDFLGFRAAFRWVKSTDGKIILSLFTALLGLTLFVFWMALRSDLFYQMFAAKHGIYISCSEVVKSNRWVGSIMISLFVFGLSCILTIGETLRFCENLSEHKTYCHAGIYALLWGTAATLAGIVFSYQLGRACW